MIETIQGTPEFERRPNREIEKKYLPLFPQKLDIFREQARPIEQLYLSHPDEDFNLRLREELRDGQLVYTAALKDRGNITTDGLDRLEVETAITSEAYTHYKNHGLPFLRKLRAEPYKNVAIDWFEDGHVHLEAEHPISWVAFLDDYRLVNAHFVDMTGNHFSDNEWRAHLDYRRLNDGKEAFSISPDIDTTVIATHIRDQYLRSSTTIVTVAGRSGSGKSTKIQTIRSLLDQNGIKSTVISTDNYNRGRKWLEEHSGRVWENWDEPIVYDLELLRQDIQELQNGNTVASRSLDFATDEPMITGVVEPAPVILIEGIYARDASFDEIAHLRYEIPTPLATSVGRRILRDIKERPGFSNPASNLRYILETAEPSYQAQANRRKSPGQS